MLLSMLQPGLSLWGQPFWCQYTYFHFIQKQNDRMVELGVTGFFFFESTQFACTHNRAVVKHNIYHHYSYMCACIDLCVCNRKSAEAIWPGVKHRIISQLSSLEATVRVLLKVHAIELATGKSTSLLGKAGRDWDGDIDLSVVADISWKATTTSRDWHFTEEDDCVLSFIYAEALEE